MQLQTYFSECKPYALPCQKCKIRETFFEANHAVRRLNKKTPWSFHKQTKDAVFERNLDSWELIEKAQHKWLCAMTVIYN